MPRISIVNSFSSLQVPYYEKPRRLVRYWLHYTGGAVGLAMASVWIVQHSRLGGSDDLGRWIDKAREDSYLFYERRLHQPVGLLLKPKCISVMMMHVVRETIRGSYSVREDNLKSSFWVHYYVPFTPLMALCCLLVYVVLRRTIVALRTCIHWM